MIVWEFRVGPQHQAEFERHYAGAGSWTKLFRRDPDYKETRLLRDPDSPGRYLTVDVWQDEKAYHAFKDRERADYERLDATFAAFTEDEKLVGAFEVVE